MHDMVLKPKATRRNLLKVAGAMATLPHLRTPVLAADTSQIRIAFNAPVATLDPAKFRVGGLEYTYSQSVFDRLTSQDAHLQVLPGLATSWEATEDLRVWTFHLRPGVKFHDGKPFDASDVLFTFGRLQDPAVGSVLRVNFGIVTKIEAVEPLTVRFSLSVPYADFPASLAAYQAAIVSEAGMGTLTTKPVGTGPFRFVSYRPGDEMVLERNPDYVLPGVPAIERAVLRVMPEYTTAVAALESGGVDVIFDLPPEQVDKLKRSKVSHVQEVTSGRWNGFVWHCGMKPFDDPRVRMAFIKIIDKPAFTDIAMFGHATPALTPIPPSHPFFRKDIPIGGADIPGARKLLAEAGFGQGMTIEMYVPGNNPARERLATAFRDSAKLAGVTVQLRVVPPDKYDAELEGKVPFATDGFYGRATPDLMLYPWYHSSGSWNNTLWHYHNPEVDKLLETARSTADKAEQAKLYGQFQGMVLEDGPGSIVYVQNFACGVSNRVKNLDVSPLMYLDVSKVTLSA